MKKLIIISKGYTTAYTIYKQLQKLFSASMHIEYYYASSLPREDLQADLIVYSSNDTFDTLQKMQHCVPEHIPYIIVRRSLNYHEINKLFELPRGTEALLVNDSQESAEETILLLHTLGIDHINLYPYHPAAKDYLPLKTAITPGEIEHVPDFVTKIIDIKTRLVDITSIVEILIKLNMPAKFANILSAEYVQDIIRLIKTSHKLLKDSSSMKKLFKTVINNVHDGLIAVDKEQRIQVFNPVAEDLFNQQAQLTWGKHLNTIFDAKMQQAVQNSRKEGILKLHSREIFVSEMPLHEQHTAKGKLYVLKDVSEIRRLEESVRRRLYQEQNITRYKFSDIIGSSASVQNAVTLAQKMAKSEATVFIYGESGTGKELFAQSIHNASERKNAPFVAINFAALSENLLESELFGYEEGSFTGAKRGGSPGLFEAAHKGTLFLDEIGDAPLPFQVKLLRVLQERQIRRVGSAKVIPLDIRIIVATNHDLKKHIKLGLMREDLYYRLNVLPLKIPPLRKRREDIMLLAYTFYQKYRPQSELPAIDYFKDVKIYLEAYAYPGNIRELQNIVEYLVNICPHSPQLDDLPEDIKLQLFAKKSAEIDLKTEILAEIKRCNEQNLPVGRRSLAAKFMLPENKVRELLKILANEGKLQILTGKYALRTVAP